MSNIPPDDSTLPLPPEPDGDATPALPTGEPFDGLAMFRLRAAIDEAVVPEVIGRYHVIEKLGEGGMGIVVKAEQRTPVRRIVAVKVIKLGLDSKSVLARFQGEQQALAIMDHPNIARVLDAGVTDNGRAFFVMEYVPGEPITRYCDREKLGIRQRLELFRDVCSAVQHAHTKGIIHRDLKPDNVLVSVREGQPTVKVIDFGIAKALHGRLTEQTYFTEQGQMIGTPSYMSPEQAEVNNLDIDTRSDVYGLGVMLYELLTGCRPFDTQMLRAAAYREIQRIIREDAPPRPSTRLTTLDDDTAAAIAHKRRTQPAQLRSQLKGELEWIPLKALRKDRAERYQTAAALEQDVSNYLQGRPLLAGPESVVYRARKLFVRNKRRFITAAVLAVVAMAGLLIARGVIVRQQREIEAKGLVKRLIDADTAQVSAVVAEISGYRQLADPLLRDENGKAQPASRQKLHTSLALLPVDAGQADYLYQRLLTAEPDQVAVIVAALLPYKNSLLAKLWSAVQTAERDREATRLRAAAALATYDPDSAKWAGCSAAVASDLVQESPVFYAQWNQAFRPARRRLIVALEDIFRDTDPANAAERGLATNLLADYAADNPMVLADLLMDADARQFAVVYPKLLAQADKGVPVLSAEIDKRLSDAKKDEDKERLAKRQANASVALLKMGQPEKVWPLLKHSSDPRARSYLIHRLSPLGADPRTLIERLDAEPDVSIRRALLLSLGEFGEQTLLPAEQAALTRKLENLYSTVTDPGLHAAAEWLLRTWKQETWLKDANEQWAADAGQRAKKLKDIKEALTGDKPSVSPQWYVNGQGQTMVVIRGPVEFLMGSPLTEANRQDAESQHRVRIGRTFALAASPVTVEQFARFGENRGVPASSTRRPDLPVVGVNWYQAAAYCNWLCKQEGISEDQWCYQPENGQVMKAKPGYLKLEGYRLPTEAEMEYAGRAGAVTSRPYGETDELLSNYAWYVANSQEKTWPVGSRKPNDLGLFDVLGNVCCWCQDKYVGYPLIEDSEFVQDKESDLAALPTASHILRGGCFLNQASLLRLAARNYDVPAHRSPLNGLRPARTVRVE